MSNANPSRLGQNTSTGTDTNELFLKVFSGEVMSTYNANTIMKDRVRTRKISSGKSAQFPAIGKIAASYHTPGSEILGDDVEHGEVVITIDDMLISSAFIANIDEAKNHYEVRSEYSKQMGQALAQTFDRQLLSLAAAATDENGIATGCIADIGSATNKKTGASPAASAIRTAVYEAAESFDEKNIPSDGRFVVVPPAVYYALIQEGSTALLNSDYSTGNGDYANASIMRVAGFEVVKSNNLSLNHTLTTDRYPVEGPVNADTTSKYAFDASSLKALCLHKDALGVVQLMDMASETEYDIRRQGTLMVSKMAVGSGILRPEGMFGIWAK